MSIKNKKPINQSTNSQRHEALEEMLVMMGYICKDDNRSLRIWVDIVGGGRDISYTLSPGASTVRPSIGGMMQDFCHLPVFDVMCTHSQGDRVYKSCRSIESAIFHSRDNPRWVS